MKPDLASLRVIEVATGISVPLMGVFLANLGAEVIKIESRRRLDGNRVRLPAKGPASKDGMNEDESVPLWHEFNAGKESVTLNIKTDTGRDVFLKLIRNADIFIQNFAPGWLERAGMSGEVLQEINPRLIMLFASGYGQGGPFAQQRVYAPVMTALGGQEALIGLSDGEVVGAMALAYGDFNATHHGLPLIFSALYERERTGRGCIIDLAQVEAVTATLGEAIVEYQLTGALPVPHGADSAYRAPHGIFPCSGEDRWATLSVATDDEWTRLANLIAAAADDLKSAALDPRWATVAGRLADADELARLLAQWTRRFDREDLARLAQDAGLRCAPVYEPDEMERDPHYIARGFTTTVSHPRVGPLEMTSTAWLYDGKVAAPHGPGPGLGDATEVVLSRVAGLTADEIASLEKEGHLA
jgi:crotonobetainyl-CoA:carnitine CoA-transferase CaiB-like acyl-CoA transferase